ncbi:hypothetical protein HK097_005435 [Rhizophlyctis rosea]|uniref:AA9 family lytic polysaccharide monooxygenase n=1 Tax=Rhizophlyctis rosea TaxID=64517 RepID=A0AAD5SF54_9FUNG|nr:hypothetical protein HK097_005435 [Rhizophlyctis rosea]
MKFLAIGALVSSMAASAMAHATVMALHVNGASKGNQGLRSPPNNNPVKDVNSGDMYCNANGNNAVGTWLPVRGGDSLTFQWGHNSLNDDIIASSHKGPIQVYITKSGSNSWVKIDQRGNSPGSWATDVLIGNQGKHYVILPDLSAGRYLVRAEWITLHESDTSYASNPARGAQIYIGCAQVEFSSGSVSLPSGVSFPGAYSFASVTFNLYGGGTFPYPGPSVWSGARGAGYGTGPGNSGGNTGGNTGGQTTVRTTTTTRQGQTTTTTRQSGGGSGAALYGQCGGRGWTGPTTCAQGTCRANGEWYSQCLP